MKKLFPIMTTLFLLLLMASAQGDTRENPVDTITRTELKDHVFFLASDVLGGRVIYEDGYRLAAQYCAAYFQQAGLMPGKKAEGGGTYLHEVPFVKKSVRPTGPLHVRNGSSTRAFDATQETRYLLQEDVSVFSSEGPLVFAGFGISAPEHGWDDFDGLEIDGKIVVVMPGAPERNGQPVLPPAIHDRLESTNPINRWLRKYQSLEKLDIEPAAILIVSDEIIDTRWETIGGSYQGFKVFLSSDANRPENKHNVMLISRDIAEALFKKQVYNPIASEDVDLNEYRTFELEDVNIDLEITCELDEFISWNVIGMVQGSDPILTDELIVIGGHLDHVPPLGGQVCNGADDNASGCAGVLEVAEAVAVSSPKRSVIFCLWTGEEPLRGDSCMGSKYFIDNPPVPIEHIKVYVNLDMIGRTRPENKGDRAHIVGSKEDIIPAVRALVKPLNEKKVRWPLVYEEILSSDHRNFLDVDIPAFMFSSGHHEDLHTPDDDPEKIDYEKMEQLSRLVYWITIEMADSERILKTLDRPSSSNQETIFRNSHITDTIPSSMRGHMPMLLGVISHSITIQSR
jgi:hypothetical protein